MNFETIVAHADNGATVEIATLHHEGKEFTAHGAILDLSNGHAYVYADENRTLTDFQGNILGIWQTVSTWRPARSR